MRDTAVGVMPLFREKLLTLPSKNELEISLFGPGYGESIVLHIPKVGWGIIDSCTTRIGRNHVIPPLEYLLHLLSPQYPKLAFVVLTHPHEDHYKGLDRVIKDYPGGTQRVCWYAGDGIRELKRYIVQQKVALRNVLPGFVEVLKSMEETVRSGAQWRRLGEMTVVFDLDDVEIEEYGNTDIRMIALSPSAASIKKYVEKLFEIFPKPGEPVLPMKDETHNLISVALFLKLGNLQIILGSDVESNSSKSTGWSGIICNRDCPELWANLVKVAHHGSENGFSPLAWQKHCDKLKPLAIMTPFCKGSILLPKREDTEKLRKVSQKLGITGSIRFMTKLYDYYPRDVVRGITNQTRSFRVVKLSEKIGFIRVRFLPDGSVTQCLAEPPASWV